MTAGSYNSTIWTLTVQGWDIEEEPSTSFKGLSWERTKNDKAQGDRFLFDFLGGAFGKVLVVLRVFYDLA